MDADITTEDQLRELLGRPSAAAAGKDRANLHELDRAFLAASPFCLLATSAADGSCDVSPKGDPPGFAHVLSDTALAIPERSGNRRVDGYRNVLSNPHVGLLFLIPDRGDTLRINGRARLVSDAPFFDDMVVRNNRPVLAMIVDIEQVFFHCSKAFLRSKLWDPSTWSEVAVPSRPVIAHTLERPDTPIEELEAYYGTAYEAGLYPPTSGLAG